MKLYKTMQSIWLVTALALCSSFSTTANAQSLKREYSVTVTNITKKDAFTPLLGVTHSSAVALFELGEAASAEIADMAESGNIAPLTAALEANPGVAATGTNGGLLLAGDTVTFNVKAYAWLRFFSMAGMILPTNDSFVALNGVRLPRSRKRTVTYHAKAYDAGSEVNNEVCADIPGPIFCLDSNNGVMGEGVSAPAGDDEGFVHIANGIHGVGDIPAAGYTWDGPVAKVEITRVH